MAQLNIELGRGGAKGDERDYSAYKIMGGCWGVMMVGARWGTASGGGKGSGGVGE